MQFAKTDKLRRKSLLFDKQYGVNFSDIHIQGSNLDNSIGNAAYPNSKDFDELSSKKGEKKDKKTRRNFMKVSNSNAYDIKLDDDLDTRTTLMIKNIPNKYTQELLLQDIDQQFKNAYDFFYLPIDFDVNFEKNSF